MDHLYGRLPDGTDHDFGVEQAVMAESLPPVERDIFVASLIMHKMTEQVGAGKVGEFSLHYEIRKETEADRTA